MKHIIRMAGVTAALLIAAGSPGAIGQVPTPEAAAFNVVIDEGGTLGRGVVLDLPGTAQRIGMVVSCAREEGSLAAFLFFGPFPAGKPVQTAVRTAAGAVERFGGVLETDHGALSGFHSPILDERADVLRFLDAAFTPGALVSNGHNAFRNRIGAEENARARQALRQCAGMG